MLKSLSIWNFALIEYVKIDFQNGLNILTGETGAGKSILMGALGMAIGDRSNMDALRSGSDFMRVEAVFEICKENKQLLSFFEDNNILFEDMTVIITRQITNQGRNSIQVNNCNITLAKLKQLGEYLVDIHSQNSNQLLKKEKYQLQILDYFHKDSINTLLEDYLICYNRWKSLLKELEAYQLNTQEMAQRLDMLNWQIKEIKDANLKENEDNELEEELKILANGEKIARLVRDSYQLFLGDDNRNKGLGNVLDSLRRNLSQLAKFKKEFLTISNIVDEVFYQLQDVENYIRDQEYELDFSPERLNELQSRLNEIDKLKLKYGVTIKDILAYLSKAEVEREQIENFDDNIEKLTQKVEVAQKEMILKAELLHNARVKAGGEIASAIIGELKSLGMDAPRLHYQITLTGEYNISGGDSVNIMFSANQGEELKPLDKIASGGELSRIALAVKTIMSGKDNMDLIVFDEVDTGVGGRTAIKMAEKIARIAIHRQVFCITHLPQIASVADAQYYIAKESRGGKTFTEIRLLNEEERLEELARMMAGSKDSILMLESAKELLDKAKELKKV